VPTAKVSFACPSRALLFGVWQVFPFESYKSYRLLPPTDLPPAPQSVFSLACQSWVKSSLLVTFSILVVKYGVDPAFMALTSQLSARCLLQSAIANDVHRIAPAKCKMI
jgi:hypothetical protein